MVLVYLPTRVMFGASVGKYTSTMFTMEHMVLYPNSRPDSGLFMRWSQRFESRIGALQVLVDLDAEITEDPGTKHDVIGVLLLPTSEVWRFLIPCCVSFALSNPILVTISVVLEIISHSTSGKKICLQCSKPRLVHFCLRLIYVYIYICIYIYYPIYWGLAQSIIYGTSFSTTSWDVLFDFYLSSSDIGWWNTTQIRVSVLRQSNMACSKIHHLVRRLSN